ncbi:DUF1850 domain-containing protein [Virgibacillus sp. MSP4-1]|uniref:DUF1850 domain-containing protein n=1 Tax=Virgibacillus sp. MSP4-1 TaxID=2700081 RepID=UPI001EE4841E|nr:DUF1850 domain-containing protein [Virgibacillus sp. MSP4-1]
MIRDQQILMKSTRFKTFGAGVPSSAGKDTFIKDGWVYMVDINREIGNELAIRTGRSTHHQIQSQNKKVKLIPQTSYSVKVDTLQLAKAIFLMMK